MNRLDESNHPIMADIINHLIVDTVKQVGATTLSITHDMTSARKISDRIAMLYQGRPKAKASAPGGPA